VDLALVDLVETEDDDDDYNDEPIYLVAKKL